MACLMHVDRHFLNMRFNFPPTPAYHWLRQLADTFDAVDVFAWTSNVDACFARSGFDPDRVYTTQVFLGFSIMALA